MRSVMGSRFALLMAMAGILALSSGCKKDGKDGDKGPNSGQRDQARGPGGPGGGPGGDNRGGDDRGGDDRGPEGDEGGPGGWPPPGDKAPAPPGVQEAMRKMANAINAADHATVKKLFITRAQFMGVSKCDKGHDGVAIVDRVIGGRDNFVEQLSREKTNVTFKNFTEGYLLNIKRGEKPLECQAKVDVKLYQSRYKWVFNGKEKPGEAHFLNVGGAWFFVKL